MRNPILDALRASGTMVQHSSEKELDAVAFYQSPEWIEKRTHIFETKSRCCWVCSAPAEQVDHLLPLKVFPKLALDDKNLSPICKLCNKAKAGNYENMHGFRRLSRPVEIGSFAIKQKGIPYTPLNASEVLQLREELNFGE
jgi:hypothetical protein